jgi:hypothetical protein
MSCRMLVPGNQLDGHSGLISYHSQESGVIYDLVDIRQHRQVQALCAELDCRVLDRDYEYRRRAYEYHQFPVAADAADGDGNVTAQPPADLHCLELGALPSASSPIPNYRHSEQKTRSPSCHELCAGPTRHAEA